MRPFHIFINSALLLTACPAEEATTSVGSDGSTTTATTSATSTGDTSTGDPPDPTTTATTTDPSTTTTTGEPTTTGLSTTDAETTDTTDEPSSQGARLLYMLVGAGPGQSLALRMVDDTSPDGPAAPVTVLAAPEGGVFQGYDVSDSDQLIVLHAIDAAEQLHLFLVDSATLTVTEATLPPGLVAMDKIHFSPDEQVLAFRAGMQDGPLELYLCALTPARECTAQVWSPPAAPDAGGLGLGGIVFSADGTRLAYGADLEGDGGLQVMLATTDAPGEATELADFPAIFANISFLGFAPAGDILHFSVDANIGAAYEYFAVDLTSEPPGPPVQLSPPALTESLRGRLSPDRSALLWWTSDDVAGDLAWIPLDGLVPGAATLLDAGAPGHVQSPGGSWSPDGLRVAYLSDQAQPTSPELYVVDVAGPLPGQPVRLSAPLGPGGAVTDHAFTADGTRMTYFAAEADAGDELFLVDLASPGDAVKLNTPLPPGGHLHYVQLSPDASKLLYAGSQHDPDVRELFLVDLAGPQPAPPVKLNPPLPAGEHAGSANFFAHDSKRVYFTAAEVADKKALFRVDVTGTPAPLRLSAEGEAVTAVVVLPPAP